MLAFQLGGGGGGTGKMQANIYQEVTAPVEPTSTIQPTAETTSNQTESQIAPTTEYVATAIEEPAESVFPTTAETPTTPIDDEPAAPATAGCPAGTYWDRIERICRPIQSQSGASLPAGQQTFIAETTAQPAIMAVPTAAATAPTAPAPAPVTYSAPARQRASSGFVRIDRAATLPTAPMLPAIAPLPAGQMAVMTEVPAHWYDKTLFGDFTVKHALIGAGVSIAGVLLIRSVR